MAGAGQTLAEAGRDPAPHEIRWLFEEVTGATGVEAITVLNERATNRRLARFDALLARLAAGEPIQYVIGHWPFRNLDLLVDRRVLIPRPETEEVAGWALAEVDRVAARLGADFDHRLVVADLGTGSGAIAAQPGPGASDRAGLGHRRLRARDRCRPGQPGRSR